MTSPETAGPVETKLHVEPPLSGGTGLLIMSGSHDQDGLRAYICMVKSLKVFLSGTEWPMTLKFDTALGTQALPSVFK